MFSKGNIDECKAEKPTGKDEGGLIKLRPDGSNSHAIAKNMAQSVGIWVCGNGIRVWLGESERGRL
jgi:hypothetical protein